MVQLKRIGATIEQRQSPEGENRKEESKDNEERSEDSFRKNKKEETLLFASYQISGFVFPCLIEFFIFCNLKNEKKFENFEKKP